MRVLVTGATGFVGTIAVPVLAQRGWSVRAAMRGNAATFSSEIEIVRHGDLAADVDWEPLLTDCDAIVHLAGIAHSDGVPAAQYDRINAQATKALVKAAEHAGIGRFVFVSSIRAQSGSSADHVLTEADEARPTDAYGASKLAAENAIRASTLRYVILRPVLVYGAGVKGNLAALIRLAASPWPLPIGAMTKRRSLLNVDSLVDAIDLALKTAAMERETFIVADREPISFAEIMRALRRGSGRSPRVFAVPLPMIRAGLRAFGRGRDLDRLDADLVANPSKLVAAGWRPTVDTAAALMRLAQQMKKG
jgi:nucleoside-diphosphate-sugar epimerase